MSYIFGFFIITPQNHLPLCWKNADALANFKAGGHTPKGTKVQPTTVRVTYDPDHLYIAVECMEPYPDKIIAGKNINGVWKKLGNHLELFYNYPDMAEKYYHLAINSNGEVIDAIQHSISKRDNSFNTRAKIATKVLKDRWILEGKLFADALFETIFKGADMCKSKNSETAMYQNERN